METGKIPDNVGFPKGMQGSSLSKDEYLNELQNQGYSVIRTKHGIIIEPPKKTSSIFNISESVKRA